MRKILILSILLVKALSLPAEGFLSIAKQFIGTPYVASTLEVNDKERLVINKKQLDCTTFVETALAMALVEKNPTTTFEQQLQRIRYQNGIINGYPSRNHYFLWWVESNVKQGIVTLPELPVALREKQKISLSYMTDHPESYRMLKGNAADIAAIRRHEQASEGKTMCYIPVRNIPKLTKADVHDGDIIAIATKKKGLDTTHIGIATWGRDGQLHLLNASQIHKKVIIEPMTLYQYMQKHPSQIGIWIVRPIL